MHRLTGYLLRKGPGLTALVLLFGLGLGTAFGLGPGTDSGPRHHAQGQFDTITAI